MVQFPIPRKWLLTECILVTSKPRYGTDINCGAISSVTTWRNINIQKLNRLNLKLEYNTHIPKVHNCSKFVVQARVWRA